MFNRSFEHQEQQEQQQLSEIFLCIKSSERPPGAHP